MTEKRVGVNRKIGVKSEEFSVKVKKVHLTASLARPGDIFRFCGPQNLK
jgi:hypothetical protein